MILNVSTNILCLCGYWYADRQDPFISSIEYVVTQEITVSSITAIKIKYCLCRALYGAAEKLFTKLNEPFKNWTASVWFKNPVRTAQ